MARAFSLSCHVAAALALASAAVGEPPSPEDRARLLAAYPQHLERIEGNDLIWRDGTRMPLDDGKAGKPFDAWLAEPDVADMFALPYPAGSTATPPPVNFDPGRARNTAFFDKVYGDCRKGEVEKNLVKVDWLPKRSKQRLPFNRINGAAEALAAVSHDLEALPGTFDIFLIPSAGTFNCRVIAGTDRVSAHGYAIAIDIALKRSDYWRNAERGNGAAIAFKNEIPIEIVRAFERHGFIWGGRWYHYDTMHFEYRPELMPPVDRPASSAP